MTTGLTFSMEKLVRTMRCNCTCLILLLFGITKESLAINDRVTPVSSNHNITNGTFTFENEEHYDRTQTSHDIKSSPVPGDFIPTTECPLCELERQVIKQRLTKHQLNKIRIDLIKKDILKKLRLEKAPEIVNPRHYLPGPLGTEEFMNDAQSDDNEDDSDDEFYGKTREVAIFGDISEYYNIFLKIY